MSQNCAIASVQVIAASRHQFLKSTKSFNTLLKTMVYITNIIGWHYENNQKSQNSYKLQKNIIWLINPLHMQCHRSKINTLDEKSHHQPFNNQQNSQSVQIPAGLLVLPVMGNDLIILTRQLQNHNQLPTWIRIYVCRLNLCKQNLKEERFLQSRWWKHPFKIYSFTCCQQTLDPLPESLRLWRVESCSPAGQQQNAIFSA